jgi:hypothetical protein
MIPPIRRREDIWKVMTMASLAMALPILPGKTADARQFCKEVVGARLREFEESERKIRITRESWHLQNTPMGDLMIAYVEGDNPGQSLGMFVASAAPFDRWFKEQVRSFCGVDLNQPPSGPPSEVMFDWQDSAS